MCVIVKLESKTGVDVKDCVDMYYNIIIEMVGSTGLVREPWDHELYKPK